MYRRRPSAKACQEKAAEIDYQLFRGQNDVTVTRLRQTEGKAGDVLRRKDNKPLADGRRRYNLEQNTAIETLENWFVNASH